MDENIKIIAEENGIDLSKKTYTNAEMLDILDKVGKGVAKHAMDCIVSNVEHGLPGERAWWSIRDAYDIEIKDQMEMLPTNRTTPDAIKERFHKACMSGDTQELIKCFELGARIYSGDTDELLNVCKFGPTATIDFFLLKSENKYQTIDLEFRASECFEHAVIFDNFPMVEYLITKHRIHHLPSVQEAMQQPWFTNSIAKEQVDSIISSSELNLDILSALKD
jgi:hypothetical protein